MSILRKVTVKRLSSISEVNGYEEINEIKQLEMKGGLCQDQRLAPERGGELKLSEQATGRDIISGTGCYSAARDATYVANPWVTFWTAVGAIGTWANANSSNGSGSSGALSDNYTNNGISSGSGSGINIGNQDNYTTNNYHIYPSGYSADSIIRYPDGTVKEYGVHVP